jgi:hypothetical protein
MASKQTQNLQGAQIPAIEAPDDLSAAYDALVAKAEGALRWYDDSQRRKKIGARRTRGAAIVLGAFTAIVPSLITILPERLPLWGEQVSVMKLNPIATIAGVVAATLILLDKFYGFSSSWMRYATTFQEIQSNLDEFRVNWRKEVLKLNANQPPTDDQKVAVYDFLLAFSKSLNESIRNETLQWIGEFRGALADIDKKVEEQRAAAAALPVPPSKGSIQVKVAEVETFEQRRWTLQLDNRKPDEKVGQSSAALTALDPGTYKLSVAAERKGGVKIGGEYVVSVEAGKTLSVDVKLG